MEATRRWVIKISLMVRLINQVRRLELASLQEIMQAICWVGWGEPCGVNQLALLVCGCFAG